MIPLPLVLGEPGPLLPLSVSLVLSIGMALCMVWILAETGRRGAARGTRPRYVFASIERPLRWPALADMAISVAVELQWYGDVFLVITGCLGIALWLVLWREKKNGDDDDDLWKDVKKRLKEGSLFTRTATSAGSA